MKTSESRAVILEALREEAARLPAGSVLKQQIQERIDERIAADERAWARSQASPDGQRRVAQCGRTESEAGFTRSAREKIGHS